MFSNVKLSACFRLCWLPTIPFWAIVFALLAWWLSLPEEPQCTAYSLDPLQEIMLFDDAGDQEADAGLMMTIVPDSEVLDLTPQQSKQDQFISWILPMIGEENKKIAIQRQKLINLYSLSQQDKLTLKQKEWLSDLALMYEVELQPKKGFDITFWQNMLYRVDIIPPSLVLTQAALESGWGTSRVAHQANNYFGLMCFTPRCGLATPGIKGDYRKFSDPQESVSAYMKLLNTRSAYRNARLLRIKSRLLGNAPSGYDMAKTLGHYSELGRTYVTLVLKVMQVNRLEDYDGADLVSIQVLAEE